MYVIRELEHSLDICRLGCYSEDCKDDAVHALDEAIAFYTGSLEGTDGEPSGVMMYALAEKRCINFMTCGTLGNELEGKAKVNIELFNYAQLMKEQLIAQNCEGASEYKKLITQLMFVPLVQGTLRYAYKTSVATEYDEVEDAEAAVYAATVLPVVYWCNASDAATIYENLKTGQSNQSNFSAVKRAFENSYECMGITCADVGGLYDDSKLAYYDGAGPCGVDLNATTSLPPTTAPATEATPTTTSATETTPTTAPAPETTPTTTPTTAPASTPTTTPAEAETTPTPTTAPAEATTTTPATTTTIEKNASQSLAMNLPVGFLLWLLWGVSSIVVVY
jgi:hypothetical protein